MTARRRTLGIGSLVAMIVAGIVLAAVSGGVGADAAAVALISLGFIGLACWVFLEIGLGEDRDRAREEAQARRDAERGEAERRRRLGLPGRPRRRRD